MTTVLSEIFITFYDLKIEHLLTIVRPIAKIICVVVL